MTVRVGGSFKDRIEEYDAIMGDLKFSGLVMTVLFVALLLLYFRQLVAVPLVFLAFGPPLLWTFALARLVVTELNFVTVFLVVILAGLGVDYTIHALTRYQEERVRGRSMLDACAHHRGGFFHPRKHTVLGFSAVRHHRRVRCVPGVPQRRAGASCFAGHC